MKKLIAISMFCAFLMGSATVAKAYSPAGSFAGAFLGLKILSGKKSDSQDKKKSDKKGKKETKKEGKKDTKKTGKK